GGSCLRPPADPAISFNGEKDEIDWSLARRTRTPGPRARGVGGARPVVRRPAPQVRTRQPGARVPALLPGLNPPRAAALPRLRLRSGARGPRSERADFL